MTLSDEVEHPFSIKEPDTVGVGYDWLLFHWVNFPPTNSPATDIFSMKIDMAFHDQNQARSCALSDPQTLSLHAFTDVNYVGNLSGT